METTVDPAHVCLVATFEARPGREDALREALDLMVEPTRAEPGCIAYLLHQDRDAPATFAFYEVWADQAALDRHAATPHFRALVSRSDELLSEPLALQRLARLA